ncbi:MAG: DNA polymerase III subunit gamma/tau [Spirulina sp. SIO3F2]|nr:DNA polymerase III subunit gamma/tau [Spirulina sp. SIO3F2]
MAYDPLHHKYRPQTFAQLVGQDAIAQTLSNALTSGRIAPAYLFTGPRGTGKTSSSRILAKSLNCLSSDTPTPQPCGECQICREITAGNAMDIVEIDAASNTGVDNIREIIERTQFAPVQCRYKVYVIDECHMLSTAAFNALLKTLEEPPDRVVFVLATTDPQRVLNTIISRCQRFDFRRIPLQAMVQHLGAIAQNESIAITPEALTLVAQIANGGLRDAESLLDQLSLLEGEITPEKVWDLVGAVPEHDLLALIQAIRSDDPEATLSQCRAMLDRGREPMIVLQNLATFYLNLLIAKTSPQRQDLVAVTAPTWERLCQEGQAWQIPEILHSQQKLKESESQLRNTTQPRLWLEVTLLGLLPSALAVVPSQTPVTNQQSGRRSQPAPQKSAPTPQQPLVQQSQPAPPPSTLQQAKPVVQPPTPQRSETQPHPKPPVSTPQQSTSVPPQPPIQQSQPAPPQSIPTPQPQTPQPAASDQLQQRIDESWQRVLEAIEPPATRALVKQKCTLVDFDIEDGVATIGVASQPLLKLAEGKVPQIKVAFEQVWQQTVQVQLRVHKPKQSASKSANQAQTSSPPQNSPPPFGGIAKPTAPKSEAVQPFGGTAPTAKASTPATSHPFGNTSDSSKPVQEAPARFVVEPPKPKAEPDPFATPTAPKPQADPFADPPPSKSPPPEPSDATSQAPANGSEPTESENPTPDEQTTAVVSSKLTQIVNEFAEEFGEVIQFQAQE